MEYVVDINLFHPFTMGLKVFTPNLVSEELIRAMSYGDGLLAGVALDTPNVTYPHQAEIRLHYRKEGSPFDGLLLRTTTTSIGGGWLFDDVNPNWRYDVIGRLFERNDKIASNVTPLAGAPTVISKSWDLIVGRTIERELPIVGGAAPLAVNLVGDLPDGLYLDGTMIKGTLSGDPGEYPLIVEVEDASTRTSSGSLVLNSKLDQLNLMTDGQLGGQSSIGDQILMNFVASGGEGPYTYSMSAGTLPTGLSFDSNAGTLTGTLTMPGAYSFDITVTDVRSATASRSYSGDVNVFGSHKYWRVYITAVNSHPSIMELEFAAAPGGANQCVGGTPISSGDYPPPNHQKENAFNGSLVGDTWAGTGTLPAWLGYSFATPVVVAEARICARTSGYSQSPRDFQIQWSDDGGIWTTAATFSGETVWPAAMLRAFAV